MGVVRDAAVRTRSRTTAALLSRFSFLFTPIILPAFLASRRSFLAYPSGPLLSLNNIISPSGIHSFYQNDAQASFPGRAARCLRRSRLG